MDATTSTRAPAQRHRWERVEENIFVYQDSSGRERFAVRLKHQGKEKCKEGFLTITTARSWRNSRKGRVAERRLFPEKEHEERERLKHQTPRFRDYTPIWLRDCRTKGLKYSTLLSYEGILDKHLIPAFGDLRMDEVSREKVRELACRLRATGTAPKTIHNVIRALSAIFTLAYEEKPLPFNPARNPSKLVKLRKGRRAVVYSHAEEILILAKVKADLPHWYPFVLCLFRTGVREGEAVALEPGDLDLRGRSVQIERNYTAGHLEDSPKDGEDRSVELSLDLVETLKGHLALQEAEAMAANRPRPRWLFTTPAGEIIRSNNFRDRIWRPTLKALGLRYRCVHATRHTYATRLIMNGANLVYVQKQLGHSSIKITVDLYTHWIEAAERGHAREVDRLMCGPDGGTSGGTQRTGETEVLAKTGEGMG